MINFKKLFGCREEEIQQELEEMKSKLEKQIPTLNPNEEYYNNKYPFTDITYTKKEKDTDYQIDVRLFLNPNNYLLPTPSVEGKSDDEKAFDCLTWVLNNIKYVADKTEYGYDEFWAHSYQTLGRKKGDCEDGAILLYDMIRACGVPVWKLRLSAGYVLVNKKQIGHCYLTYYCEETAKWVVLDWCYWPNTLAIKDRPDYKDESNYKKVWFSFNEKHSWSQGLNTAAKRLLK